VLNAASIRQQQTLHRPTRGGADKTEKQTDAYIPIPDNTGLVDDYSTFYPPDKWKEPVSYLKTSATAEDAVTNALIDGFTYYMDERDKEWLDKNNEEARGEGTSAQGAVSISGTRTSQRSAKSKGKDPELMQPTAISEDEFELIMGIFEKVTHDKTPFLHHVCRASGVLLELLCLCRIQGHNEGSPFPPFSDYQETFATPLAPSMFAVFVVPTWVPQPAHMLRLAKMMYSYWKERRTDRGGHRVIPALNVSKPFALYCALTDRVC
jgi:enhancer of polycomb-like protein